MWRWNVFPYNNMAGSRRISSSGASTGTLCNIKVGSFNCRGLCDKAKRVNLLDIFK